jgi:hypothetical protein
MDLKLRGIVVTLSALALVGLAHAPAPAADRSDVDAATKQVQQGANQMGQGNVLGGAGETAKGIGNTVVAGAKFTSQKIEEAGQAAAPAARTAWDRTKEGAVAFGSTVREFFGTLFGN